MAEVEASVGTLLSRAMRRLFFLNRGFCEDMVPDALFSPIVGSARERRYTRGIENQVEAWRVSRGDVSVQRASFRMISALLSTST